MAEQFGKFRVAYMNEFLNNRENGEAGKEVMRRLVTALETSMVSGIDIVATRDPKVGIMVGKLHAALVAELSPNVKDS